MKYEYKSEQLFFDHDNGGFYDLEQNHFYDLGEHLTKYGQDGWELINIIPCDFERRSKYQYEKDKILADPERFYADGSFKDKFCISLSEIHLIFKKSF